MSPQPEPGGDAGSLLNSTHNLLHTRVHTHHYNTQPAGLAFLIQTDGDHMRPVQTQDLDKAWLMRKECRAKVERGGDA